MFKSHAKDTKEDTTIDTGVTNDQIIVGGEDVEETTEAVPVPDENENFDTVFETPNSIDTDEQDIPESSESTEVPIEEVASEPEVPSAETIPVSTPDVAEDTTTVEVASVPEVVESENIGSGYESTPASQVDSTSVSYDEDFPADFRNILDWLEAGNSERVLEKYSEYRESREKTAQIRAELEEMLSQLK